MSNKAKLIMLLLSILAGVIAFSGSFFYSLYKEHKEFERFLKNN